VSSEGQFLVDGAFCVSPPWQKGKRARQLPQRLFKRALITFVKVPHHVLITSRWPHLWYMKFRFQHMNFGWDTKFRPQQQLLSSEFELIQCLSYLDKSLPSPQHLLTFKSLHSYYCDRLIPPSLQMVKLRLELKLFPQKPGRKIPQRNAKEKCWVICEHTQPQLFS
jgi:hypothetical protein